MDDIDRAAMRSAVEGLYAAAKMRQPDHVVFCPSPITGYLAAAVAAGVWYLRDKQRDLSAAELSRAASIAVSKLVAHREQILRTCVVSPLPTAVTDIAGAPHALEQAAWQATREAAALPEASPGKTSDDVVNFLTGCIAGAWRMRSGGNQLSAPSSFYSFLRYVVQIPIDWDVWDPYEKASIHGGPRYMHERFTIVSDRPRVLRMDDAHRPHCDDGPSHTWSDGWSLYHWHGTRVPARLITAPETYTRAELAEEANSELHRALAERLGWDRYLELREVDTIDRWVDPVTNLDYELLDTKTRLGPDQPRLLRMRSPRLHNGSQPHFIEPVDPELRSAQAARKWQVMLSNHPDARYYRHGDLVVCYAPPDSLYWPSVNECNEHPELEYRKET